MVKIDFKKELKHLYGPTSKKVGQIVVPKMNFLMIDGQGNPNTSPQYSAAVEVLFSVAYRVKFSVKKGELGIDYGVLPLEGLWWVDNMSQFFTKDKSSWKWRMMIMQPDFVTAEIVDKAVEQVRRKKNPKALDLLRFDSYAEGTSAQILHIGPFSEEGPAIEKVHVFIRKKGRLHGFHHEIYLSDIRKAAPEKWRTVISQPYKPAAGE
jgi:hypothetical protein